MGCIFETFTEIFIEVILEFIFEIYIKLMLLFAPDKNVSEKTKITIKNTVTTISVILFVVLFVGVFFLLPNDPILNKIGRYMTFIPLTIIVLQITFGVVAKIIIHFRK